MVDTRTSLKNGTPAVGAIAQWDKQPGRLSGHVAYVEETGPGYIIITEDNYGGVTQRRKLTPGTGWPNQFIHINDVTTPPAATSPTGIIPVSGTIPTGRVLYEGRVDTTGNLRISHWTGSTWQHDNFGMAVRPASPSSFLG